MPFSGGGDIGLERSMIRGEPAPRRMATSALIRGDRGLAIKVVDDRVLSCLTGVKL